MEYAAAKSGFKELAQKEHLATHDTAIMKYKNYVEKKPLIPAHHRPNVHQLNEKYRRLQVNMSTPTPPLSLSLCSYLMFQGMPGLSVTGGGGPPGRRPPCSPHCPGMAGRLPDLQCSACQCWFHGRCQGVPPGVTKFRCRVSKLDTPSSFKIL